MQQELNIELDAMRKALVIRNYAARTVETYVSLLKRFLLQLNKPVDEVRPADIREWQYFLADQKKISWSQFNQIVCSLKFYFRKVRCCEWPVEQIPFQRTRKRLPSILTKEEVAHLLATAAQGYVKHYAILATLYSTGIRLGEVVKLKIVDIDSTAMLLHIRQGKGGKDNHRTHRQRQTRAAQCPPAEDITGLLSLLHGQADDLVVSGGNE